MARRRWDRNELLARVDLPALLDELAGPSTGMGRSARWRCIAPDHDDVHPSVTVGTNRRGIQRWTCWSGGHGGTAIDAIHVAHGVPIADAIEYLAQRVGLQPTEPGTELVRPPPPPRLPLPLDQCVYDYVERCARMLWEPIGRDVLNQLVDVRGLDPQVLRANRVGADPGPSSFRRPRGLPRAGPGAVFPVFDADARLKYCQTRYLDPPAHRSKYGNPSSHLGDNPKHGWTRPKRPAREPVVVCEGFPDAYTINAAGYTAVAILGAMNATPDLAKRLAPAIGTRPAIIAFDGDDAGRNAARIIEEALHACGIMVVDLPLPSGADLNSWVTNARRLPGLGPSRPDVLPDLGRISVPEPLGP